MYFKKVHTCLDLQKSRNILGIGYVSDPIFAAKCFHWPIIFRLSSSIQSTLCFPIFFLTELSFLINQSINVTYPGDIHECPWRQPVARVVGDVGLERKPCHKKNKMERV
jgi:hypothetical protein